MSNQLILQQFETQLSESIAANKFVKLSLGNYQGNDTGLKQVYVRTVVVKRANVLSFTYRYKTRDIFKNYPILEGITLVMGLLSNDFKIGTLHTTDTEVIVEHSKKGDFVIRKAASNLDKPSLVHDREKKRIIGANGKVYLQELNITDKNGVVFKNAQDKFRQINRYIEILSSLIKELPNQQIQTILDMGSGKGYLTFALYDYLNSILNLDVKVTGVEYRQDLVDLCNVISNRSDFSGLRFVQGTIEAHPVNTIDLLIALHACDTATDEAIFKGIKANAGLIVVAPCCHKQIRKEIERHKVENELTFVTKYGIFLERQAEMVTDGLRALILEYFGYKTKVFEFISDIHTPKNILIVGIKSTTTQAKKDQILAKIAASKAYFGIANHHLETLLEL